MWIKTVDGNTVFATNFIHTQVDCQNEDIMQKLTSYQIEANGIVVYPEDNLQELEEVLCGLQLVYEIEQLTHDLIHIGKTQGIKYSSRTEAINHLLEDKEPESQIIPNIKNTNNILGNEIIKLQNENKIFGNKIVKLELELLNVKKKVDGRVM